MHLTSALRYAACAVTLGSAAVCALAGEAAPIRVPASFVQNGEASFVVSYFEYALSKEANEIGACPKGMSKAKKVDLFALSGGGAASGPDAQAARGRLQSINSVFERNICQNPEKAGPDPDYRTVEANVPVYGIDLDGQDSRATGKPAPGTCAHDDFPGFNGERGIDNQFYRAVGCVAYFQPSHGNDTLSNEMLTGAWGILIRLRGVDDIRNDSDIEVDFFANNDPIQLSAKREAVPFASYAPMQDPRFRATTHGRIVDGVLTTDPVDVRFRRTANGLYFQRPLQDARLHVTLSAAGIMDGYLAGYTSVADLYDVQFGYSKVSDINGKALPASQGSIVANGAAAFFGYNCNGAYYALVAVADGHRDAKTGQCTAVSTQYRIRAVPAFVVDR